MSELGNGKMLKEIFERIVRLDEWSKGVDEKLDKMIEPLDKIGPLSTRVTIQWWLLGVLFVAYVVRLFIIVKGGWG